MIQIPHEFILLNGIPVPEPGRYGAGMIFSPKDEAQTAAFAEIIEEELSREGLTLIRRRQVPVDRQMLGKEALDSEPLITQIFVTGEDNRLQDLASYEANLESSLYRVRKLIENRVDADPRITDKASAYIVSLSTRTLVYKGMLTSGQLRRYYLDLQSPYLTSAMAMVHSRFSTNTFPQWRLAQAVPHGGSQRRDQHHPGPTANGCRHARRCSNQPTSAMWSSCFRWCVRHERQCLARQHG